MTKPSKTQVTTNLNNPSHANEFLKKTKKMNSSPEIQSIIANLFKKSKNKGTSSDLGALAHIIIKDVKTDRKLQVLTIARRLLYCCPLHEIESASS